MSEKTTELPGDFFEEELEDARIIQYVRNYLPQELQEKFTDEMLYYFHDVLVEYLVDNDVLNAEADEEGYVTIDAEAVAQHIAEVANKELDGGPYMAEDLLFVVNGELECQIEETEDE